MINAIIGLIILYIIYRLSTAYIIPRYTRWKIGRYKKEIEESSPDAFKDRPFTGRVHPSIRKYYKDNEGGEIDELWYMKKFEKENNEKEL